jgi:hypothetical protein
LLVTHDNRILDVADRLIRIEDGCLEEVQISMERIMAQVRELLDLISQYPACWLREEPGQQPELEGLHAEFIHTEGSLSRQVAGLTHGQMPADLANHAQALQEMLSHILSLEDTVLTLGKLLFDGNCQIDSGLADALVQSSEFLLLTTAETLRSPSPEGLEILKQLTQDRGELMATLRDRYLAAQDGLEGEGPGILYAATQAFARQVYFLHHLAIRYFCILDFLTEEKTLHG